MFERAALDDLVVPPSSRCGASGAWPRRLPAWTSSVMSRAGRRRGSGRASRSDAGCRRARCRRVEVHHAQRHVVEDAAQPRSLSRSACCASSRSAHLVAQRPRCLVAPRLGAPGAAGDRQQQRAEHRGRAPSRPSPAARRSAFRARSCARVAVDPQFHRRPPKQQSAAVLQQGCRGARRRRPSQRAAGQAPARCGRVAVDQTPAQVRWPGPASWPARRRCAA